MNNLGGEKNTSAIAFALCLIGLVLRFLVSEPTLLALGIDYAGDVGGNPLVKIHVGSYFIFLSFIVYLAAHGNALRWMTQNTRVLAAPFILLATTVLILIYWVMRDASGVGLILDTHLIIPMVAIILLAASPRQSQFALTLLMTLTALNAILGVCEGLTQTRLLPFPDDWVVNAEEHFRASAFIGHPLNNAMLTAVTMVLALSSQLCPAIKTMLTALFLLSLIAFGGRAALVVGVLGAFVMLVRNFRNLPKPTDMRGFLRKLSIITLLPIAAIMVVGVALSSGLGDRLLAFRSFDDSSAHTRLLILHIFEYMRWDDVVLGMSVHRLDEVRAMLSAHYPINDIENPWLLMLLMLGVVMFPLWLAATIYFYRDLWRRSLLGGRVALIAYLLIASTSNSFGRKDSVYVLAVAAIILLARTTRAHQNKTILRPASHFPLA